MGWWRVEIAALGLAGCALDSIVLEPELEQAELGSVCGADGPFHVLPFGEHEGPINLYTGVTRFDERMYFVIGEHPQEQGFPSSSRLVSTGPCGESARVIAHDIARVFEHPRWPGLLLGYTLVNDVVVLDPAGVEPPAVLLRAVDFHDGWSEHGVVARAPDEPRRHDGADPVRPPAESSPGRLWLQPYPLDADAVPQPVVLVDPMPPEARWEARDDEVLVRAQGRTLERISLPDGTRTTLLEGIEAEFSLTADGRFVVVLRSASAVHVYDRETGIVAPVGVSTEPVRLSPNRIVLDLATAPPRTSRIVRLPSLELVDLPDHWSALQPTGDSHWLVEHANGGFGLFDEDLGEVRAMLEEPGEHVTHREPDPHRFEAWVPTSPGAQEGRLYEVDYEDGGVRILATRSSAEHHHVSGGRVVTTTPSDDLEAIVLALTDDEGNTRWQIDRKVRSWFARFQDSAGYEDDVVIYAVSDGQRSGMWLARLPPPP